MNQIKHCSCEDLTAEYSFGIQLLVIQIVCVRVCACGGGGCCVCVFFNLAYYQNTNFTSELGVLGCLRGQTSFEVRLDVVLV